MRAGVLRAAGAAGRRAPPRLLVFGGSQGARALNELMPQIVARLLEQVPGLTILHQSEREHAGSDAGGVCEPAARIRSRWRGGGVSGRHAGAFAEADLILCRSGSTVAELAAAGKPSLLVPFPSPRTTISARMRRCLPRPARR